MVYNGKHHRNPSGHTNRVKWLLSMCNWNSAHLGDVFRYIKDPTPHDDNAAHFAWKKRWVEAYKEAQLWIKIGGRYYRKQHRLEKQVKNLKTDYEVLSCSVGDFNELQDRFEEEQRKNNKLFEQLTEAIELLQSVVHQYKREGVEGCTVEGIEAFIKEAGYNDKQ